MERRRKERKLVQIRRGCDHLLIARGAFIMNKVINFISFRKFDAGVNF